MLKGNYITTIAVALSYLVLSGCSKKQADEIQPAVPEVPGTVVTYTGTIQALIQTKCAICHAPGGQGSSAFNFTGYTAVVANAARIKQQVFVLKRMPLTGSLSTAELQSLQAWFDQGMPQ
jgi:uncharacterized membrane protein